MPVTYTWTELKDRRSAKGDQLGRSYTRVYRLHTTERVSEAAAFLYVISPGPGGAGLNVGVAHPEDTDAKIRNVSVDDEADDGLSWLATIEYSTARGGTATQDPDPDPLARPPEIEYNQLEVTEEVAYDGSDPPKYISASNGQQFDPLPQRERGMLQTIMTRNDDEDFFKEIVLPLMDSDFLVNADTFTIDGVEVLPLHAKLKIRSTKMKEGAVTYYRTTYTFTYRGGLYDWADGWRERILDVGTQVVTIDGWEKIIDTDGMPVTTPYPLDGGGQAMPNPTDKPAIRGPYIFWPEVDFEVFEFE